MRDISKVLGWMTHANHEIEVGVGYAGISFAERDEVEKAFLAGGYPDLQHASYQYALGWLRERGRLIDFGDDIKFAVESTIDGLDIPYDLDVVTLRNRAAMPQAFRQYPLSYPPIQGEGKMRKESVILGRFITPLELNEADMIALLSQPSCPYLPSGAWVREGFLDRFPRLQRGEGSIAFPDAVSSHWQDSKDLVCFPILGDFPTRFPGNRDYWPVYEPWPRQSRVCFVLKPSIVA
jgi:hypothetical protein